MRSNSADLDVLELHAAKHCWLWVELESTSWGTPRASIDASIESGVRSGLELADSRALLIELQKLHRSLIRATDDLDQLTNGETPSLGRLTEARWNLSKASLSRRLLWGKILFHLSPRLDPEAIKTLRDLQHSDMGLLHASAKHVSIWTADSIIGNWRGYRTASRRMRDRMKAGVELEREFLYPLLRTHADIGNNARRLGAINNCRLNVRRQVIQPHQAGEEALADTLTKLAP